MENYKTERTKRMKQSFIALHNDGKSIKEIAEIFNLHYSTVYYALGDIAKENNLRREDLLERSREKAKNKIRSRSYVRKEQMKPDVLITHLDKVKSEVRSIIEIIDQALIKEEKCDEN